MKLFFSLPKSEAEQTFYTRYASLIPTLNILGYLAQIVSALTEFGIIYTLVLSALAPLFPGIAPRVALIGAVGGTAFLEIGLRKFAPYSARSIIHKRYKSWDGWITGFVLAATVGLLIVSGTLSFAGSRSLVDAVAPSAEIVTTAKADSTLAADQQAVRKYYGELIEATKATAAAAIIELDNEYQRLQARELRTGSHYTTAKENNRSQLAAVKAERTRKTAELRSQLAEALKEARKGHTSEVARLEQKNQANEAEAAALVDSYGGNLGYFTIFCLLVFLVCVTLKELHHAGAGIVEQIEPGAFDFEAGPLAALSAALGERFNRWSYGIIHKIEKGTTDAPEPVAAPTVWKRERTGIPHRITREGVERKIKKPAATTTPPNSPRKIGFKNLSQPMKASGQQVYFNATHGPQIENNVGVSCAVKGTLNKYDQTATQEAATHTNGHEASTNLADLTQRLKQYKKRLGEHQQKAKVQQRNTGEISKRTAAAIENNRKWVAHYEQQINSLNYEQ